MKIFGLGTPEVSFIYILLFLVLAVVFGCLGSGIGKSKGYSGSLCFVAGLFLGIIGLIVVLLLPNKKLKTNVSAEDLLNYKKLLDSGAITQEEFDAKKKELIN